MARVRVFEELMLAHDSQAYPCHIVLRLDIAGSINHDLLHRCARQVTSAHPILRAHAERVGRRLTWKVKEMTETSLLLLGPKEPLQTESILLNQQAGWRLLLRPSTKETVLYLIFHHACVDGIGALAVAKELIETYQLFAENDVERSLVLGSCENEFRCEGLPTGMLLTNARKMAIGLLGVHQFLMRIPRPLLDHSPVGEEHLNSRELAVLWSHFDPLSTNRLLELVRENNWTLNDLLSAQVFTAVDRFSKTHGCDLQHRKSRRKIWWRMMVPVSLREPGDQRISNCVSSIFLDRTPSEIEDAIQLPKGIHDEMRLIKNNKLGYMMPLMLWIRRWLPGGIAQGSRSTKCTTSFVFSNVGRVWADREFQDRNSRSTCCSVKAVSFVPPLAPFVHAAFSAATFDKKLTLAIRYDPKVLNEGAARQLLGHFVEAVHSLSVAGSIKDSSERQVRTLPRMDGWN